MAYRGIVKNGKIELEPPVELPEGTRVTVEPVADEWDEWLERMKELGDRVAKAVPPGTSVVEQLFRDREERERSIEGSGYRPPSEDTK